jgi:predicted RNA-binding protein YlxR (DUF448 family)
MLLVKTKHVPQRTCVGCRSTSSKREFVRVVRTPEGTVEVDPTAKRAGRGAYICAKPECWSEALKKDRLGHALRTAISPPDRATLERYGAQLTSAGAAVGS